MLMPRPAEVPFSVGSRHSETMKAIVVKLRDSERVANRSLSGKLSRRLKDLLKSIWRSPQLLVAICCCTNYLFLLHK